MARILQTLVLVLIVFLGSWALFNRDRINGPGDLVTLAKESIESIPIPNVSIPALQSSSESELVRRPNAFFQRNPNVIRIATFCLNGETGAAQRPNANRLMTEICAKFDAVAIQDVAVANPEWLRNLAGSLKAATGDRFEFITSPFLKGRQYVTIYNANRLNLDHEHFYTVNDPDKLFERPALVGWFRVIGPKPEQAFTFSLANLQLSESRSGQELVHLSGLYRAIRQDGRGEDDIIFAGDFRTGENGLSSIKEKAGLTSVAASMPTNTMRTAQFDNILFGAAATTEFRGAVGVFDFMQHYNLFLEDSLAISQHLPVWAEFSLIEGAIFDPGSDDSDRVAAGDNPLR